VRAKASVRPRDGLFTSRIVEYLLRLGIAAGAAIVLTPGTDLCNPQDIARLAAQIGVCGFAVESTSS
jgi:fructose-1-phosphate kinase PfkB-like protein